MTPLEDQVKVAEARGRLIPQTPPEAHRGVRVPLTPEARGRLIPQTPPEAHRGVRVPLTPVRHLSNWHCQAVSNISL